MDSAQSSNTHPRSEAIHCIRSTVRANLTEPTWTFAVMLSGFRSPNVHLSMDPESIGSDQDADAYPFLDTLRDEAQSTSLYFFMEAIKIN